MINPFKNFTKKKIGGLLLIFVIIIAFGFGGFGGGFSTGNQNNIAKINNTNISTQDFMDYLNESGLSQKVIKDNIDKNIIEELLSTLISTTLLDLEIKELNLTMTKNVLIEKIKNNKNFQDENAVFKRTLYEKFLLTNNTTASMFEIRLKNNELQKQLFTYISGGTKSPEFLINKFYKEENKKLDIDYIDLKTFYKKARRHPPRRLQCLSVCSTSHEAKRRHQTTLCREAMARSWQSFASLKRCTRKTLPRTTTILCRVRPA